jgi:hypothetical protein
MNSSTSGLANPATPPDDDAPAWPGRAKAFADSWAAQQAREAARQQLEMADHLVRAL